MSWSKQVHACAEACAQLAQDGIEVELIDLRTIWPWDREAVLRSCAKTGHLLVVHEAVQAAGFGAEIAATAAEAVGCRVRRLGAPRIPVGYSPVLEAQSRIGVGRHRRRCAKPAGLNIPERPATAPETAHVLALEPTR